MCYQWLWNFVFLTKRRKHYMWLWQTVRDIFPWKGVHKVTELSFFYDDGGNCLFGEGTRNYCRWLKWSSFIFSTLPFVHTKNTACRVPKRLWPTPQKIIAPLKHCETKELSAAIWSYLVNGCLINCIKHTALNLIIRFILNRLAIHASFKKAPLCILLITNSTSPCALIF